MEFTSKSIVELVDHMGGDTAVINSARVSFAAEHKEEALTMGDEKLIAFLMRKRHGTPFESTVLTFRIKTPIFVMREWIRHRIGSFNEMSARYKEMPNEFFLPETARSQHGKPGRYTYEDNPELTLGLQAALITSYEQAMEVYYSLLEQGVAKEQARLVLPVGIMTQFYWTVNGRSIMNFLELRQAPSAMKEIRDAAEQVHDLFVSVAPITVAAFDEYGKAP